MAINYNEINTPINAEKRDPFYGRSKSEIGLGLTPNMSYSGLETAILANVKSTIDEGVAYNYGKFANETEPILANLIKLKPNSSRAVIHFSLGTWTSNSEFISRDTATLELRSNKSNVSYNLFVTEPYPNNNFVDSTDERPNRSTALTSTKVIIRQFNTGGWLVQLKVIDWKVDAIWMNVVESKNIDIQNPMENIYSESEFGRNIEFYCDKSRISTNLEISGASLVARSLTHNIPIKLKVVDPEDYYNSTSTSYTLSNVDISGKLGTSSLVKNDTLISIPIKTDEETCKKDQLIPLTVNRLNHQIKLRFNGAIHNSQNDSWRLAQTDQTNLSAFFDTDPEAVNEYPISVTELTHDLNLSIGKAEYTGSMPESGNASGAGYSRYEFVDGKVNYATLHSSTTGRNDFYIYDSVSKSWIMDSAKYAVRDKSASISTKSDLTSSLNLVLHGLDHDIKIEAVNSSYRSNRGSATDINKLWNSPVKLNTGIRNLTWEIGEGNNNEPRRNSYVTGHFKLNTFEKDVYQCMDLTVHGMDHNIKLDFYRLDVPTLGAPTSSSLSRSDRYRPNSNGQDLRGTLDIDTFSGRVQNSRLQVIDGRYSDCTRGLALKIDGNFLPWDQIDDYGDYASYLPTAPSSDEIQEIFPTINGIPFTGDFRYSVLYPSNLETDGVSKKHSLRNINITAFHSGSSLREAGEHNWETLSTQRIASYNSSTKPTAKLVNQPTSDVNVEVDSAYGLTRLTTIDTNLTGTESEKYNKMMSSLGANDDSMSVLAFKSIISSLVSSNASHYATKDELSKEVNQVNSSLDWKEAVDTYNDLNTKYPNPTDGWTVNVKDTDITYRYTGTEWIEISANSIPMATSSVSGKMSASDKAKLDTVEQGANNYTLPQASSVSLGGVKVGNNISINSGIISITKDNVTNALGYVPPVTNTEYEEATSLTSGLMSNSDKAKLDRIEANANNYILPQATNYILGGVIIGDNISLSEGKISVDKLNVTNALGYTPPESDTTYELVNESTSGLMSSADKVKLNSIDEGANNYVLPKSTSTTLGGITVGEHLTITDGKLSLTSTNVTEALGYIPPVSDTTYQVATESIDGLMSKDDRVKLDSVEANANNYTLPQATSSVLGGVTVGNHITVNSGKISLTKQNVIDALGYEPIAEDLNTEYGLVTDKENGLMSSTDKIKLNSIDEGANKYILPKASTSSLGGVTIGNNITLDSNLGRISLTKDNVINALDYTPISLDEVPEYEDATTTSSGLMSAADKLKLDGIEPGVGSYVLPEATDDRLGGVKIGNNITVNGGIISLTKQDVVGALGYEPPAQDLNTEYGLANHTDNGLMSAADKKKLDEELIKTTINTSTLDSEIDPSTKIDNLLNSMTDDNALISVGVLKAIVKAINYRFEKLETNMGI